jgi:hypothetical protein
MLFIFKDSAYILFNINIKEFKATYIIIIKRLYINKNIRSLSRFNIDTLFNIIIKKAFIVNIFSNFTSLFIA